MDATDSNANQPAYATQSWRIGDLCPDCGEGKLDFNGLFQLECPHCGFIPKNVTNCGCSFRADAV